MAIVVTGLTEWQRSLVRAAAAPSVRPIVERAGLNIKNRMRQEATGHKHAPRLPASITYTLINSGSGVEVGPRTGGQGSLAFYYFGNSKVNASIPDPIIALHAEADRVVALIAAAAVQDLAS